MGRANKEALYKIRRQRRNQGATARKEKLFFSSLNDFFLAVVVGGVTSGYPMTALRSCPWAGLHTERTNEEEAEP